VTGIPQPLVDAVEEIRREKLRGASWALLRGVQGLVEAVEAGLDCSMAEQASSLIEQANKTMAPLANLAFIVRESCRRGLPGAPGLQARRLLDYQRRALDLLREAAASIRWQGPVATISYSSSVEALLIASRPREVLVFESRPGGEGAIFAANLRVAGLNARLLPDTMMVHGVEEAEAIVYGADAVTMDGCLFNKVGTLQLSLLSSGHGKHTIAVFDATKIHPSNTCESHPIEERSYMAAGYGPVRYPVFDRVPARLVSAAITEEGPMKFEPDKIRRLWEKMIETVLGDER